MHLPRSDYDLQEIAFCLVRCTSPHLDRDHTRCVINPGERRRLGDRHRRPHRLGSPPRPSPDITRGRHPIRRWIRTPVRHHEHPPDRGRVHPRTTARMIHPMRSMKALDGLIMPPASDRADPAGRRDSPADGTPNTDLPSYRLSAIMKFPQCEGVLLRGPTRFCPAGLVRCCVRSSTTATCRWISPTVQQGRWAGGTDRDALFMPGRTLLGPLSGRWEASQKMLPPGPPARWRRTRKWRDLFTCAGRGAVRRSGRRPSAVRWLRGQGQLNRGRCPDSEPARSSHPPESADGRT